MRISFLFLLCFVFFPSLTFAIGTCDYARQVLPPLNVPAGQVTSYDYSYGYSDSYSAIQDCWSEIENNNACGSFSQGGYDEARAFQSGTVYIYVVCNDCQDTCPTDNTCDTCEQIAECDCSSTGGVVWDNQQSCLYHCAEQPDCPDSDDDGLPDCCGGNPDCPDSDGDGLYDCCGDGDECEDSDDDGTPDSCDACPNDPSISEKEICSYEVASYCDGVSTYSPGDVCGTYTTGCDGGTCKANGDDYYQESGSDCGFICCEQVGCVTVRCDVDPETCEARTCECPDGQDACAECKDPDCECEDGTDTCEECQLPDGSEGGDGGDSGTCECPDGQEACAECKDPDCSCDDGTETCAGCQLPKPTDLPGGGANPGELLPDEILVGECIIDLTGLKEYLSSAESFPFNYLNSLLGVLAPLVSDGSPPVIDLTFSLDAASSYSYIPDHFGGIVDFSEYSFLSSVVSAIRFVLDLVLLLSLISYFIARYHNFHGISR